MVDAAIPGEWIIAGFASLGGAVAWLAHKWDASNARCEARNSAMQKEMTELRNWSQKEIIQALQANSKALDGVMEALRKLKYEVRELDPADFVKDDSESDLHPAVKEDETTEIILRARHEH